MEASGSWWAPQSSKLLKPSSSVWRVRFPSASAKLSRFAFVGGARVARGVLVRRLPRHRDPEF